ncbi:MAG: Bax inhibitor-1 family protein [Thermoguttaceae bacterium]
MSSMEQYEAAEVWSAEERGKFITRTYLHLAGAVGAFVALEALLLNIPGIENLVAMMLSGKYSWLIVLGAFMFVSWIADKWAFSSTSLVTQYLGLGLYVAAEAVIFVPILFIAKNYHPGVIPQAATATVALFCFLTVAVMVTRFDFSFLRTGLIFAGLAALGFIVASIIFGFALGPIFTYLLIAFACLYILYDTSNVLLYCRTDQYVGAALALFASVALLFWYILQLYLNRDS